MYVVSAVPCVEWLPEPERSEEKLEGLSIRTFSARKKHMTSFFRAESNLDIYFPRKINLFRPRTGLARAKMPRKINLFRTGKKVDKIFPH